MPTKPPTTKYSLVTPGCLSLTKNVGNKKTLQPILVSTALKNVERELVAGKWLLRNSVDKNITGFN